MDMTHPVHKIRARTNIATEYLNSFETIIIIRNIEVTVKMVDIK